MSSSLLTPGYDSASIIAALFAFIAAYLGIILIISILVIVAHWKLFSKAGEPGWAAIVPFYGNYVLFKIIFGNGWFFLLLIVPVVNVVVLVVVPFMLAKVYGKGIGYGFGLLFLAPIFYLMLAFGSAEYVGLN